MPTTDTPKKLYHYTAAVSSHLGSIVQDGQIDTTESNISFAVPHAGPDVVWLTDIANPHVAMKGGLYQPNGSMLKLSARITVETDALAWTKFAQQNGASRDQRRLMNRSGGHQQGHWYVVGRPIPRNEWIAVELWRDGRFVPLAKGDLEALPITYKRPMQVAAPKLGGR